MPSGGNVVAVLLLVEILKLSHPSIVDELLKWSVTILRKWHKMYITCDFILCSIKSRDLQFTQVAHCPFNNKCRNIITTIIQLVTKCYNEILSSLEVNLQLRLTSMSFSLLVNFFL